MATFAERFCEALEIRHISAAELSRKLNISEGTLSQYKKGLYEPKQRRTEAIAFESHRLRQTPFFERAFFLCPKSPKNGIIATKINKLATLF